MFISYIILFSKSLQLQSKRNEKQTNKKKQATKVDFTKVALSYPPQIKFLRKREKMEFVNLLSVSFLILYLIRSIIIAIFINCFLLQSRKEANFTKKKKANLSLILAKTNKKATATI